VVAVEADWPDAYRVNRWVRKMTEDGTAEEALGGFRRFPTWMWRNADVLALIEWLREHNAGMPEDRPQVGFYGLDLYSLLRCSEGASRRGICATGTWRKRCTLCWSTSTGKAGVIYKPESERVSHYFNAALSGQFDAVVHWDRTRAVEPLELTSGWEAGEEAPETYPTGM
jgi:erythromycin esterase-like protein